MTRPPWTIGTLASARGEDGSSLPEMLVAAGLTLVALSMLGSAILGPLAAMVRSAGTDERRVELERAGDEAAALVRRARPGVEGGPILLAGEKRIELREGTLGHGAPLVLHLTDGVLWVERPDAPESRAIVSGLDVAASRFIVRTTSGEEIVSSPGEPVHIDAAVVTVELVDRDDGPSGRTVSRTVHLPLRYPLAVGGLR
jgi:hypothetical protein